MPVPTFNLTWHGPLALVGSTDRPLLWEHSQVQANGVYVLAWPGQKVFAAHYIGITQRTFAKRLHEHMVGFLSGKYHLYDTGRLDELQKEYTFRPQEGFGSYARLLAEHLDELQTYFRRMAVFLAPLDSSKHELECVEAHLAQRVIDRDCHAILDSPTPRRSLLGHKIHIVSTGDMPVQGLGDGSQTAI